MNFQEKIKHESNYIQNADKNKSSLIFIYSLTDK